MVNGYTRTTYMEWKNDRILRIHILEDADIGVEEAKENFDLSHKLTGGREHFALIYDKGGFTVSPEAREFAVQNGLKSKCIATAYVTTSLANRLLGNFYIQFNKPTTPTRIFTSETSAHEWLLSFMPGLRAIGRSELLEEESDE